MVRLLVVEHEPTCGLDRMHRWLQEAGVEVTLCRPHTGDEVPERAEANGLVVLGGRMGALDDRDYRWLPGVRRMLSAAVDDAMPVLGVCLGAQLLAAARGGRVEVGEHGPEAGVVNVRWRGEAAGDALVGGLPGPFPGPSMHRDAVVDLPFGATWLGGTSMYANQVFRVGHCAWGLQFHPEVSLASFAAWAAHYREGLARWAIDADEVVDAFARRNEELATAGRQLTLRFAEIVARGADMGR